MRRRGDERRRPGAKNGRGQGRAKRYAQCHFEDIWALKRVMARRVERLVSNLDEVVSIHLDIKTVKNPEGKRHKIAFATILLRSDGRTCCRMHVAWRKLHLKRGRQCDSEKSKNHDQKTLDLIVSNELRALS